MKKYAMETAVGIFVAIGLVCVGYLTLKLGNVGFFEGDQVRILAKFSSVSGLRAGSTVQIYGIEVGRVDRIGMDADYQQAQVEMLVRRDVKVYEDAIASIKTEGLIGDKYVSIDPGGMGDPLKTGGQIIQTQAAVDVGDLISKYAFGDVKKEEPEKKK